MAAPFSNAIGWAQYQLLGGWKNLAATAVGYFVLMAAVMYAIVAATSPAARPFLTYWGFLDLFLALQVIVVPLYGTFRVGSVIRADVTGKLIESHRLMPISGFQAVLGYVLGSTLQIQIVFATNFLLGAVAASGAGISLRSWAFSNAVLLIFSICLWFVVAFYSLRGNALMMLILMFLMGVIMSGGHILRVIPAANVLVTPAIGTSIFDMRAGVTIDWTYEVATLLQIFIAAIFIIAAARRYRGDAVVGFDPVLSLVLLAAFVMACALGVKYSEDFLVFRNRAFEGYRDGALVSSFAAVLLLAMLPVGSAVKASDAPAAGHRKRTLPPIAVVVIAVAIALGMAAAMPATVAPRAAIFRTAVLICAWLVSVRCVLGIGYRLQLWPRRLMFGWLVLVWCVPVIADLIRQSSSVDPDDWQYSQLAFLSPPAEIYHVWGISFHPFVHDSGFAGLAAQCLLALALLTVYHGVVRPRTGGQTLAAATN